MSMQQNDQAALFLTIRFSISYLFAHSLNVKQFFWPIDMTLSDDTTPGQSGLGPIAIKGYSTFPKIPKWNLTIR